MLNDLLQSFTQTEDTELETLEIKIKNNTITLDHAAIQIHNISMISRNEFKTPVTIKDFLILAVLFIIALIPPHIGVLLLALYAYYVYSKHQKHLKSKYFITLNLGSSQNYRLFFPDYNFRNKVYDTLIKSFNSKNQNIFIDISKKQIDGITIFETGSTQNTITGDHNTVDSNKFSGDGNIVAFDGDINQNSNISKNSTSTSQSIDLPWETINLELDTLIKQSNLASETRAILEELKASCQNKDIVKFTETIQNNKRIFDKEFLQNTISGTLSGVITTILTLTITQ